MIKKSLKVYDRLLCFLGFHQWSYKLSEVGYVLLDGWPLGTKCSICGKHHPRPILLHPNQFKEDSNESHSKSIRLEIRAENKFMDALTDLANRTGKSKAEVIVDALNFYENALNEHDSKINNVSSNT
jgi:hypothetical protein